MNESIEQIIDTEAEPVSEQTSEDKFFGVANEINTSSTQILKQKLLMKDQKKIGDLQKQKLRRNLLMMMHQIKKLQIIVKKLAKELIKLSMNFMKNAEQKNNI